MDSEHVAALVERMRARKPLVQCMPNMVAAEITANVLLASGAAPAMVVGAEEAPEFAARKATALSINMGALTSDRLAAMREAASSAASSERRPPWVLDPVACGGTAHRTEACHDLLARRPAVVRGNASEVLSLARAKGAKGPRGVDASDDAEAALPAAKALALEHGGMVVVVSGPTDFVTDGQTTYVVSGGAERVTQVTGTGCALSALVVAFVACADGGGQPTTTTTSAGAVELAAACCAYYKGCAAAADGEGCGGPGSFKVRFLDALALGEADLVAALAGVSVVAQDDPSFFYRDGAART